MAEWINKDNGYENKWNKEKHSKKKTQIEARNKKKKLSPIKTQWNALATEWIIRR